MTGPCRWPPPGPPPARRADAPSETTGSSAGPLAASERPDPYGAVGGSGDHPRTDPRSDPPAPTLTSPNVPTRSQLRGSHVTDPAPPGLRPRVPPPGQRGLGPHEAAIARAVREHRTPQPLVALGWRLPDVSRRQLVHHLGRMVDLGVVELVPAGIVRGYRWRPEVPSVYDQLGELWTCPRCGSGDGSPDPAGG